ncbi:N-acetylmuramoyl-L-alanine amidase [Streptococcus mitis]
MLLTIHDANLQKVAFVDNNKQNTLNYYADTWVRSLATGSSTFEFTVFKKAIKSDTALAKAYQHLNERAWVSFKYKGKNFIFNVMTVEEDEQTIKCYCENLNLELINEMANPYKATKAMSFAEYCEAMGLLNYSHLVIGINELSDKKRTVEWQGQETKLARLLSLAKKFDAEIEFGTELNTDSTIKKFSINVYHENDDNHQGVGRIRNDIQLKYGKNIKSIRRKVDKTGIFNSIHPTGKRTVKNVAGEDIEEAVTIQGLDEWKKYNKDGVCEFYQLGSHLVAPISMQLYPSTFTHSTGELDQYTRKDFSYDTDNPKELRRLAYNELKKHCYPAITYEVDGYVDVEIGDTVKIHDAGFAPLLNIQTRVSEQQISFSNPANNKTVFSNFKALENQLSDGIQEAFERLFEQSKPYTIKLSTSNGIIFKNNSGETIITPTLYKGGKLILAGVTWRWSLNDTITTGMTYTVRGQDITNTVTLTIGAYISNDRVAVDQISLVNVSDGRIGAPGKSTHMHFAFSEKPDGSDLSLIDNGQRYYGYYTDEQESGSTDKTMYKWFDRWGKIKSDREDIEKILDTKADQALTQEQLNALNEKAGIIQAEVEARASVDEVNNLIRVYNDFVKSNDTSRLQAEKDLIATSQRVSSIAKDLGELSDRWNFIDTYMSSSNEGFVIGKNDGSSSMLFSPNGRISMYSAGVEVMYISQGVIHIENGIFSKTIQIGRFREEQYHINPDMNVIRYVG